MVGAESVYGKNAGIVWRALNEKGKLGMRELSKATDLNMLEVNGAIGWLARENKIRITGNGIKVVYELTGH